jgi:hypothetical protein
MISRCVEPPASVVAEFDNHEVLVKIGLAPSGIVVLGQSGKGCFLEA